MIFVVVLLTLSAAVPVGAATQQWLSNGNFENGTTGWAASASLSLAGDGNTGPGAAKVTLTGTPQEFWLYATPRPVSSTVAGTTYTATGFVRSDPPGRTVCLRIREYTDATSTTRLGEKTSCITATDSWQAVPALAYTAVGSGGTLTFHVYESATGAQAGDSFEADGLSLTSGDASPPPPSPPTVSSFSPSSGTPGTSVTVNGTNFTGATTVTFGGVSAAFSVSSATQLTATVPQNAATGPIAVTTGAGTGTSAASFTVTSPPPPPPSPPTVSSFSPTSGTPGTSVTVTGTGFTGATTVTFGGASATFTVGSATQLTATVPQNAATGPIAVTTGAGTGTSSSSFTVTSASPPPSTQQWLTNGNFENGTTGWAASASLSLAGDGNTGPGAAKVTLTGTPQEFWLYANPRPVSSTVAGTTYTATGFVRSDTPGRTVCLRIREYTDATSTNKLGEKTSCVTAGSSWQAVPALAYTAVGSGGTLTFHVYESATSAQTGDSFEADGLSLTSPSSSPPPPPPPPPVTGPTIAAAGDIACPPTDPNYNGGNGTGAYCMQAATANVLASLPNLSAILPLGDEQYQCGEMANFSAVYALTWGRFKSLEHPVPGNHEYGDTAACSPSNASGYYSYFGAAAGDPKKGYYSYDVGTWHLIALNSNCAAIGGCGSGSAQEKWLRNDLAGHPASCTLAYWHHPRFSAGQTGDDTRTAALWTDLVNAHADLVLVGHDHTYQRFAPMNASGAASSSGVRELVVGTGGEEHHTVPLPRPTLQVSDNTTFGVLTLTLGNGSYSGQFVPASGTGSFTDSFAGSCV